MEEVKVDKYFSEFGEGSGEGGTAGYLAPDFTPYGLTDESLILDAIDVVSETKQKVLSKTQKKNLAHRLTLITGGETIGSLRTNGEWTDAHDIPLMLKVYLKHVIRSAPDDGSDLTPRQRLECDFNYGLPFEISAKGHEAIDTLSSMGFTSDEVFEAHVITSYGRMEEMMDFLLQEKVKRHKQRKKLREKLGRSVPYDRHRTVVQKILEFKERTDPRKLSLSQLHKQLQDLEKELALYKNSTKQLEHETKNTKHSDELALFECYLRGVLSGEGLSAHAASTIPIERRNRGISQEEYDEILENLGYTEDTLIEKRQETTKGDWDDVYNDDNRMCVVCYENERDQLMRPCNHCVICKACRDEHYLEDVRNPETKVECPMCSVEVTAIKQLYF